jgi:hypothetical protein
MVPQTSIDRVEIVGRHECSVGGRIDQERAAVELVAAQVVDDPNLFDPVDPEWVRRAKRQSSLEQLYACVSSTTSDSVATARRLSATWVRKKLPLVSRRHMSQYDACNGAMASNAARLSATKPWLR